MKEKTIDELLKLSEEEHLGRQLVDNVEILSMSKDNEDCVSYAEGHIDKFLFSIALSIKSGGEIKESEVKHGYVTYRNGVSYFSDHMVNSGTSEPVTYFDIN